MYCEKCLFLEYTENHHIAVAVLPDETFEECHKRSGTLEFRQRFECTAPHPPCSYTLRSEIIKLKELPKDSKHIQPKKDCLLKRKDKKQVVQKAIEFFKEYEYPRSIEYIKLLENALLSNFKPHQSSGLKTT